jgi:hypothetical protein
MKICKFGSSVLYHSFVSILMLKYVISSGFEGRNSGFTSIATLASSLDYTSSKSSLKLLLPLASDMQDYLF